MIRTAAQILADIAATGGERTGIPGDYDLRWVHTSRREGLARLPLVIDGRRIPAVVRVGQARCGTRPGYARHLRRREPTCGPCRAANTAHQRERVQRLGVTR